MADKLTPLILDALGRAASEPAGTPLYGSRSEPGLFPSTAVARTAAARALAEGLLEIVRVETRGRQTRELATATEAGLNYLLDQLSPRSVLEDFVRVLERREGEIKELIGTAHRLNQSLDALKKSVTQVLPRVHAARVSPPDGNRLRVAAESIHASSTTHRHGASIMNGTATLDCPPTTETAHELAPVLLARLADWSASAAVGQDCPLPELYRSLSTREVPPTVGEFHDCLRELVAEHRIYLHPWTGPLYALPEPTYALLVGHNIAYYASARTTA